MGIDDVVKNINSDYMHARGGKLNPLGEIIVRRMAEYVNVLIKELEEKQKYIARNAVIQHEEEFLMGDCD